MGENSRIEWTDHTWNPWIGCTKVSAACDSCYAERWGKRFGVEWGNHPRRRTSAANWREPLKWNRKAQESGKRLRVFCASLADWLDNKVDQTWRSDLGDLIAATPHLDWLLLTKRPQNYEKLAPWPVDDPPPNIWFGATTGNQDEADRNIPEILRWPAAVHFISAEPLLAPVDPTRIKQQDREKNALTGDFWIPGCGSESSRTIPGPRLDWVICGGESGPDARPMHPDWARSLRDQCAAAQVPFFFKQHGHWALVPTEENLPGRPRMVRQGDAMVSYDGRWEILGPSLSSSIDDTALPMRAVGKARAGRVLDGREHNELPS